MHGTQRCFLASGCSTDRKPRIQEAVGAGTGVCDYTATMLVFTAIGVVAVAFAVGLKLVDRGPDSHGLELPSAEAASLNEAKRADE